MSIKQIVNTPDLYNSLMHELDLIIEAERNALERAEEATRMYQHQGALRVLRRLKNIRESVNGRQ